MINPVTFPRVSGTTATYMHPVLQSTLLQSARTPELSNTAAPAKQPTIPAVTAVDRTAAYSASLARDAATAVLSANATVRTAPNATSGADPVTDLAREIVLERASTQVGVLLDRAAAERRVAVRSGVPATRLAEINSSTSRLYHALDVLA